MWRNRSVLTVVVGEPVAEGGQLPTGRRTEMPDAEQRYDFPTHGFLTKAERWLYPGGRPNGLGRLLNRGWAVVHGAGLLPRRFVTLEVPGRRTGRMLSFPLVMVEYEGERYLVSMLGERSSWVRNVGAAGGRAVLRHGRRETVRLEEVDPDAGADRAPVPVARARAAGLHPGRSRRPARRVPEGRTPHPRLPRADPTPIQSSQFLIAREDRT
jgi:hypothetical protein